jgi:hypothetical protein
MSILLQPLQILLAVLSESIRKEQQKVIQYLQLENQIHREKLGGKRVLLSDDQRRLLAVSGKSLGRRQLGKIATIAQADTILRWHRELIDLDSSTSSCHQGRPPTDQEVVDLVLRMARENVSWGYKRIEGALHHLGYSICSSTVANILRQHGIAPAPTRKQGLSWSTFLKSHLDVFDGIDLEAISLWLIELVTYLIGHISLDSESSRLTTTVESNDQTPRQRTLAFQIVRAPETATHPARVPPLPIVALPFIPSRKNRHAA